MTLPSRAPSSRPPLRGRGAAATGRTSKDDRPEPSGHGEGQVRPAPTADRRAQQPGAPRGEEALLAALSSSGASRSVVRYRGFVLLPQPDLGWLVRPERSPMTVLPFRTPAISLSDVKALVDWRLDGSSLRPLP